MIKLLKDIYVVVKFDLETGITTVMCAFDDKKDAKIYMNNQRNKKCNLGCNFKMVPTELKSQKGGDELCI